MVKYLYKKNKNTIKNRYKNFKTKKNVYKSIKRVKTNKNIMLGGANAPTDKQIIPFIPQLTDIDTTQNDDLQNTVKFINKVVKLKHTVGDNTKTMILNF